MAKQVSQSLKTAEQRIGPELKRLREDAGLSLRTFAELAGFSAGFISQVENSVVSPSIASLEKMASTLGVTLAELFTPASVPQAAIVRVDARPSFRSSWSKACIDALMPLNGSRRLEALMVTLDPGGANGKRPAPAGRDQFAMVWEGRVVLTHAGEDIQLNRGDSVLIRAGVAHRWFNAWREAAQVLIVSSGVL
jgi:transcriptional regulator with XRE-family HTH domain